MIKFSAARLAKEPIELEGAEPPEFLEIEPGELLTGSAPVSYRLRVKEVSGGALIEGSVATGLTGVCGRCLAPVKREIRTDSVCLFRKIEHEEEVDISEDIRAEIALELPMTLLCSDECRGLCPICGANRNTTECGCSGESGPSECWNALDQLKL